MSMPVFSTSDLSRKSGDIITEALRHPVTLTQHSKPRLVLLNIEDYARLIARADTRQSHTLAAIPDALFDEAKAAVEALEDES